MLSLVLIKIVIGLLGAGALLHVSYEQSESRIFEASTPAALLRFKLWTNHWVFRRSHDRSLRDLTSFHFIDHK